MMEFTGDVPFEIDLRATSVTGRTHISVSAEQTLTVADVAAIDSVMVAFGHAASNGMFAGRTGTPSAAAFVTTRSVQVPWTVQYEADAHAVDHGAFRILLNMLIRIHRLGTRLQRLVIRPADATGRPVELGSVGYPQVSDSLDFPWSVEEVNHSRKNRVIEVEFRRDLDAAESATVLAALDGWDQLVGWDAFALDIASIAQGDNFTPGESYFTHLSMAEHTIVWIVASDAAYHALFNLLGRFDETVAPVDHVVVR